MSAKRKNDSRIGWGRGIAFSIVWTMSYLLPLLVLSGILSLPMIAAFTDPISYTRLVPVLFALGLILSSLIQAFFVRQILGRTMRGWLIDSLIGTIIALMMQSYHLSHDSQPLNIGVLFLPLALMQTRTLWRYVRGAWLWPLVHIAGTLIYTQGFTRNPAALPILCFFVYGLTLCLLWTQPRNKPKAKIAHDTAEEDAVRAARLQERDEDEALWERGDEKTLQREV